ncbi:hypothetical protein AAFC00_003983 [Neodothiora populina]|uniref:Uncharacterized protein n=1 Tax=Neodothiora populina TaxID=2781224 RepID=A0ABR3PI40_9PEZI
MDHQISALHSERSSLRLEQIAALRASGVGNHVDLPQLVVSGDQSAGKSSVLEGLTGLPFPRQDGVCTRFGTEILLQNSDREDLQIIATLIPCKTRDEATSDAMQAYRRQLESFADLPEAINDAGVLMGIRGFGENTVGPSFADDLFRVEVTGPVGLHLSVVDLPGIILVPNEEQTEQDVEVVHKLVDKYIANPRTIILAVVQAGNDIANQSIIIKSRKVDPEGKRTVGIITKPDLINEGSETRIALLAKNQDTTKLKLGFFLLKNPTPKELEQRLDLHERRRRELAFFQNSPWREQDLDADRIGIRSLQVFLQQLLDRHIEHELPKVRKEIQSLMRRTEGQLQSMGEERPDFIRMRGFLSRLSMTFHNLSIAATNGGYHECDPVFFPHVESDSRYHDTRLRATVHQLNIEFAANMRVNGAKRKVVSDSAHVPGEYSESPPPVYDTDVADGSAEAESLADCSQVRVTRQHMIDWVSKTYRRNRGKELPGNTNHVLLSELFHVQSSMWSSIAGAHLDRTHEIIVRFTQAALRHVIKEELVREEVAQIIFSSLNEKLRIARQELDKLHEDERQQPITYNHYYTDNIQKSRQASLKAAIEKAMKETTETDWNGKLHVSNNTVDGQKLLASLQHRINVDMDVQACEEALAGLDAYYKVALKTYVDNVCKQVIERHLLRGLSQVFSPETVVMLSEEDLRSIAAEPDGNVERRNHLRGLLQVLDQSLEDLRR